MKNEPMLWFSRPGGQGVISGNTTVTIIPACHISMLGYKYSHLV
jgi:hypothetical protein